jgi:chromosome segregation ATPase
VLKDDLIVRLDQFSSEMLILREEIKSLQTVKACLQLRITELEEEARKAKEELSLKTKKSEEEDETLPISQRKRFTRAEMARVLMERNQYKERLMDLQEAVRWTEMIRASKLDHSTISPATAAASTAATAAGGLISTHPTGGLSASNMQQFEGEHQHQEHKKRSTLWKL